MRFETVETETVEIETLETETVETETIETETVETETVEKVSHPPQYKIVSRLIALGELECGWVNKIFT